MSQIVTVDVGKFIERKTKKTGRRRSGDSSNMEAA